MDDRNGKIISYSGADSEGERGASSGEPAPRILVVDDDPEIVRLCEEIFSLGRYRVKGCCNGAEAVELLHSDSFDVVLLDLALPDMDGRRLLATVVGLQPWCSVVVMTAYASVESAVETMRLGALDYIEKPFSVDLLSEKVALALERGGRRHAAEDASLTSARDEFLSILSHELLGPFTVLEGYLELLRASLDGEAAAYASGMRRELGRLRFNVENLVSFAELVSEGCAMEWGLFPLGALIDESCERISHLFDDEEEQRRLISFECDREVEVRGAFDGLVLVVSNVLSNAVKVSLPDGRVRVEGAAPDGAAARSRYVLRIHDEGPGFEGLDVLAMLSSFTQLEPINTRTLEGLGLGLSLVARLAPFVGVEVGFGDSPAGGGVVTLAFRAGADSGDSEAAE